MIFRERTKLLYAFALAFLSFVWAEPVCASVINVTADTSVYSGTTGSLDFQFNANGPGGTDTAVISNFLGGSVGSVTTTGTVTGDLGNLPVTLTAGNNPLNELTQTFTYGSSIQFTLDLTTSNTSPGGSFYFTMLDNGGNSISSGNAFGNAIEIDVDSGGFQESPLTGPGVTATPEPPTVVLGGIACLALVCYRFLQRRADKVTCKGCVA